MKGITDINTVKYAILETNGQISVLPYADQTPPSAQDLQVKVRDPGLPIVIINDGRILDHNLKTRGYDTKWLDKQLQAYGVKAAKDVYLLTVDEQGTIYFAAKEVAKG